MAIGVYHAPREGFSAPTVGDDIITLVAGASEFANLIEVMVGGEGTTSTAMRSRVQRSSSGTTGGGAITPSGAKQGFAASGIDAFTTWSSQPTAGAVLIPMPFNLNGGGFYWHAGPEDEAKSFVNGNMSLEHGLGAGSMTALLSWREQF